MGTWSRPVALVLSISLSMVALGVGATTPAFAANDNAKLQQAVPQALKGKCARMSAQAVDGVVPQALAGLDCLDRGGDPKVDDVGSPELELLDLVQLLRHVHAHQVADTGRDADGEDRGDADGLGLGRKRQRLSDSVSK